jgi:hypothetical protein
MVKGFCGAKRSQGFCFSPFVFLKSVFIFQEEILSCNFDSRLFHIKPATDLLAEQFAARAKAKRVGDALWSCGVFRGRISFTKVDTQ